MARALALCAVLAAAAVAAGCGGGDKVGTDAPAGAPSDLTVSSPGFAQGGPIPARFTCAGAGERPVLRFAGVPAGAVELALLVVDPDAGGFVHWTVYGLAPDTRGVGARALPAGAREGDTSKGEPGWTPPCPPKGDGPHRYRFELYWLRERSGLDAGAAPDDVVAAIRAGAGGRGELIGRFGRS